mmetsp:Transcript_40993/g.87317  ORF Transcript_40993/g.87317 Transcript_40993/m.87317 type:complete len:207 (+) Transcript_40993:892-1512(+)
MTVVKAKARRSPTREITESLFFGDGGGAQGTRTRTPSCHAQRAKTAKEGKSKFGGPPEAAVARASRASVVARPTPQSKARCARQRACASWKLATAKASKSGPSKHSPVPMPCLPTICGCGGGGSPFDGDCSRSSEMSWKRSAPPPPLKAEVKTVRSPPFSCLASIAAGTRKGAPTRMRIQQGVTTQCRMATAAATLSAATPASTAC